MNFICISHVTRRAISSTQFICFPRNPGERHQTCIEGSPDPPDFFWEVACARIVIEHIKVSVQSENQPAVTELDRSLLILLVACS